MADSATNGAEQRTAAADGSCPTRRGSGGCRLVQELHEGIEQANVTGDAGGVSAVGVRNILRVADPGEVQAVGRKPSAAGSAIAIFSRQRAVLLEHLTGDAHFHVVGLTREDHQRLVLRLPAKTADGAIIAVVIEGA